jgi:hypothetical protein
MYSSSKVLTVEETTAELCSYPLSDISNTERSDTGTVDSNLPIKSVWKISQSCLGDSSDSEHSSTDRNDSEISEPSDTETVDGSSKRDKTPNAERL